MGEKRDSEFNPVASSRSNYGDYPVDDKNSPISVCNFNAVGGSSILYSAHYPRFINSDFNINSSEGLGVDWPIKYDQLIPYYEMNEKIVKVSGKVGDSFYPELNHVFNSPVPLGDAGIALAGGFKKLGWHWWPSYAAINTDQDISGRQACQGLGPCNTGCPTGAKATVMNTYLSLGLLKRVDLLSEATVSKVLFQDSSVTGVELIEREGNIEHIFCKKVVLTAGAIGTPRILLNSLKDFLNKNNILRKDLIGKNLMMHPLGYAEGYFSEKINTEKGPQGAMLYSLQFYRPSEPVNFKLGFMMHALRGDTPIETVKRLYNQRKLKFGKNIYKQFTENFGHNLGIAIICEDLPNVSNMVELDYDNLDSLGVPGVKVRYELSRNSKSMMTYGLTKARQVLMASGAKKLLALVQLKILVGIYLGLHVWEKIIKNQLLIKMANYMGLQGYMFLMQVFL